MKTNRIVDHPVLGKLENQKPVTFTFDGKTYTGFEGDTIASALLANGIRQLRVHEQSGANELFIVILDIALSAVSRSIKHQGVRACMTPVTDKMVIQSGQLQPTPFASSPDEWPRTYTDFEKKNMDKKVGESHV